MALAKLYVEKTAIIAADLLNDRVVPFFDEQSIPLNRILTDRGAEYCDKVENHSYQLYLAMEDIDHSKTKANSPHTNGICERFHKTMKNEFYDILRRANDSPDHLLTLLSSQENLQLARRNAGGCRSVTLQIQRAATTYGKAVLRQNTDANISERLDISRLKSVYL